MVMTIGVRGLSSAQLPMALPWIVVVLTCENGYTIGVIQNQASSTSSSRCCVSRAYTLIAANAMPSAAPSSSSTSSAGTISGRYDQEGWYQNTTSAPASTASCSAKCTNA